MATPLTSPILADRQEIIDVTIAYCWALDTKDWEALRQVFLPEATALLASATPLEGFDAIVGRIMRALTPLDDSQHMVTNHQIVVNGDEATCRCYLQAQHVRHAVAESGGENYIIAGRYEDRMVRTADGWRIAHRELIPMWREGNPAVIRRD